MLKQQARLIAALVFAADLGLVTLAFLAAHALRSYGLDAFGFGADGPSLYPLERYLPLLPLALAIWGALLWGSGRYRSHRRAPLIDEASAVVRVSLWATALFALAVWGFRLDERLLGDDRISRGWIGLFAVLAGLLLLTEKLVVRLTARQVRARGLNFRTILVVGTGRTAGAIAEALREHRWWGYRILGFVALEAGEEPDPRANPRAGALADLPRLLSENVVDEVVFALTPRDLGRFEDLVLALQEEGILVRFALDVLPHAHARVDLEELDGVPLVTLSTSPSGPVELTVKRVIDVALSTLLLVLALPVLLLVACAIKLGEGGAVLFRQRRCGLNGRVFTLYKFRTMVGRRGGAALRSGAPQRDAGPGLQVAPGPARDPARAPAAPLQPRRAAAVLERPARRHEPRRPTAADPRGGRPLRALAAAAAGDETRPHLSLADPRPQRSIDFEEWMRLDLEYIDSWSPWLDLKILAKTVPVVLSGRGAS